MTITSDKVDWEAQYRALLKQELAGERADQHFPWSKPSAEVYLPRTLLEERLQPESEPGREGDKSIGRDGGERTRPTPMKVQVKELWKKLNSDRVLLLEGPAGMGKTTWSTHLVQAYLDQPRHEYQGDLPIRIPFRDLVAEGAKQASVKNYLTKKYDHLGKRLYDQWDSRQAVLILDGLDEVVDPAERTEALKNLLSTGTSSRRPLTMLTSRPLGHSLPLVTAKIELQGLSPQEQRALITLYQSEFRLTNQQIEQFLQRVGLRGTKAASSSPVRFLLERPGHLVQLLEVYAKTNEVLETETEVLTHLLEKRLQFTGRSHPPVTPDAPDNPHKKRMVLETMAVHLLACRQGHSHSRAQLLGLVEQVLHEHDQAGTPLFPLTRASSLLTDFVQNSGLLTRVGLEAERYQVESVIWLHHLVGSALANRQIVQALNWTEAQVVDYLNKKSWDEEWEPVLKSYVGQVDNPFPLFERLIDKTQDDLARHRLGTAGRCLREVRAGLREQASVWSLRDRIALEAFERWKVEAKRGTQKLVEISLRGAWAETEVGTAKLIEIVNPSQWVLTLNTLLYHTIPKVLGQVWGGVWLALMDLVMRLGNIILNVPFILFKYWGGLTQIAAMEVFESLGAEMLMRVEEVLQRRLVCGLGWPDDPRVAAARALGRLGGAMSKRSQEVIIAQLNSDNSIHVGAIRTALSPLTPIMPELVGQALMGRSKEWKQTYYSLSYKYDRLSDRAEKLRTENMFLEGKNLSLDVEIWMLEQGIGMPIAKEPWIAGLRKLALDGRQKTAARLSFAQEHGLRIIGREDNGSLYHCFLLSITRSFPDRCRAASRISRFLPFLATSN